MHPTSQRVTWKDVRTRVQQLNPTLFNIIDEINPSSHLPLYILKYPYGYTVSDDKYFYFPRENGEIEYRPAKDFPYTLVMDKCIEILWEFSNRVIPFRLYESGTLFPYQWVMDLPAKLPSTPLSIYTGTAGKRSVSIMQIFQQTAAYHELLKKLQLPLQLRPDIPSNHFEIVKNIAEREEKNWHLEILIFDHPWREKIFYDKKFTELKTHLLQEAVYKYSYFKNIHFLDVALTDILENNKISIKQTSIDILRKVFLIALGDMVGYHPCNDEAGLPRNTIINTLRDLFQLDYDPILIEPHSQYPKAGASPIYFSFCLHQPLLAESKSRPLSYLYELIENYDVISHGIENHIMTSTSAFGRIQKGLDLQFYTERGDGSGIIQDASGLIPNDDAFNRLLTANGENFQKRSLFTKALISIAFKGI